MNSMQISFIQKLKLRAKQSSRLSYTRAEEANTKLFYLYANGRRRKNVIHSLQTENVVCHSHEANEPELFSHYSHSFWPTLSTWFHIQLGGGLPPRHDLSHLEEDFSEEEMRAVIQVLTSKKAPGPDGFIGIFFKRSWQLIKSDVLLVVQYFFQLHNQHLSHLNTTHIVLIPKKSDAKCVTDFQPINLTHFVAKLLSKLLANRLAPKLNELVSRAQSAFIKKRCIQDNFLYTQNLINALYRTKQAVLFSNLTLPKHLI